MSSGSGGFVVLLLFPAFEDGTLLDELQRLAAKGQRMQTQDVLDVFEQVFLWHGVIDLGVIVSVGLTLVAASSAVVCRRRQK